MLAQMASAPAIAEYYGPRGGTFGYIELTGSNPVLRVPPGEPDAQRVIEAVMSMELLGGTAYAPAIELAIRAQQAATGSPLVVETSAEETESEESVGEEV